MQARRDGTRLLTFTIETELRFASPADIERFCGRLAGLVAGAAQELGAAEGGRAYRLMLAGRPASRQPEDSSP